MPYYDGKDLLDFILSRRPPFLTGGILDYMHLWCPFRYCMHFSLCITSSHSLYIYIYLCIYKCLYIGIYIYIYVCVCVFVCLCGIFCDYPLQLWVGFALPLFYYCFLLTCHEPFSPSFRCATEYISPSPYCARVFSPKWDRAQVEWQKLLWVLFDTSFSHLCVVANLFPTMFDYFVSSFLLF